MLEFIKYCIHCMCIFFSAAFGYNPKGLNWETGIVGMITIIVIFCCVFSALYVFLLFAKKHNMKVKGDYLTLDVQTGDKETGDSSMSPK